MKATKMVVVVDVISKFIIQMKADEQHFFVVQVVFIEEQGGFSLSVCEWNP